jgi:Septum formation
MSVTAASTATYSRAMSDPRNPGSPNDPYQPGQSAPQQPTDWQSQQPSADPARQSQQPADPAWQPRPPTDPAWQPPPPAAPAWQPQQPQQPGWQPGQQWQPGTYVAPKKSRTWLRTAIVLGVVAALVIGFIVFRDRLTSNVNDLAVGECIDKPTTTDAVSDVQRQPCNEPHDGEVFAVLRHTGASDATYPVSIAFDNFVNDECEPAIQTYTGRTVAEILSAGLDFGYFYPSASSWADGDRRVTCFILRADDQKMTGSVRAGGPGPATAAPGTSAPST